MARPTLDRIAVFPVKSLDPLVVESARIGERGLLDLDRRYAMFDAQGRYVNGKREPVVHRLRSAFDPETETLRLREQGTGGWTAFDLRAERGELEAWLSTFFGYPVTVHRDDAGGYPDDEDAHGPTVISTATVETVASWFPDIDAAGVRRRFRANLEVGGVPPFWEDRLFAGPGEVVAFSVGDATIEGVKPCQRCVVPTRDPETGEATPGFRERFVARRCESLPDWAAVERFDHYYRLMVNTRVQPAEWGPRLQVGDEVEVGEVRPA